MNILSIKSNRKVIPRWRRFKRALQTGELAPLVKAGVQENQVISNDNNKELSHAIEEWKENKSLCFAADLVGASFMSGEYSSAIEAAQYIIERHERSSGLLLELANRIMSEAAGSLSEQPCSSDDMRFAFMPDERRKELHNLRILLKDNPRDAIAWSDMAYFYALSGLRSQSVQAMEHAIGLFPENRYLLRSSSRLFLHVDEPDRAYQLLTQSKVVRTDPWILAAQIAVSDLLNKPARFMKPAVQMLGNDNFSSRQLSELACATGTQELLHGSMKTAKKLLKQSILAPTENVLGQILWMSYLKNIVVIDHLPDDDYLKRYWSFEAYTYSMSMAYKWQEALNGCMQWLCDQPLSKTPAIHASYLAATYLEDYPRSGKIAEFGLIANPGDTTLLNNLAFSLINQGKLIDAREILAKSDGSPITNTNQMAIIATNGLLHFREGDYPLGRIKYSEAIEFAKKSKKLREQALATIYWAKEELTCQSEYSQEMRGLAIQLVKEMGTGEFDELLTRFGILKS